MLMKINLKMNEDDPKWEIIPDSRMDIGVLQYLFISGGDPGDLDEYITTDNRISNIAAYVKEHRGSTVRDIIRRSKEFIEKHPMVMEGSDLVTTAGSATVTLESTDIEHMGITEGFELFIDSGPDAGGYKILSIDSKNQLTLANNLTNTGRGFSYRVPIARFRLAGGLIGILAAANEVIAKSQARNLTIIFSVIFILCAITYRSFFAGFLFIISIGLANLLAFAFMGARGIGLNVNTLPVSSLGIGLGVDYGIYVISRIRDEYRISKDVKKSIIASISTAGKAVVYTATTLSAGVAIWGFSPLRFQAEMGLLLAFLMMANMLGGIFLLPAIVSIFKPRFVFPGES
jgi:predicted RND superfamily exporter protein